jgi:hypothetical protein
VRDAVLPWLLILLLCGLLLPAAVDLDDPHSTVTVTFVQPATAADADSVP